MGLMAGIQYGPLGTTSQTSSSVIPGAANLYGQLSGNLANTYGQAAQGQQGLLGQAMGLTQNYGQAESQLISNQYAQSQAQQNQSLMDRGLGNTSVVNNVDQGLQQSQALAQNQLAEQVNSQKLGALGSFGSPIYQGMMQGAGLQAQLGSQLANYLPRESTYGSSQYGILPGQGGGGMAGGAAGLGPGSTGLLAPTNYSGANAINAMNTDPLNGGGAYYGGTTAGNTNTGTSNSQYTPRQPNVGSPGTEAVSGPNAPGYGNGAYNSGGSLVGAGADSLYSGVYGSGSGGDF